MNNRKLILSAAIATAFGMGSTATLAASVTTGTLTQIYATELFQGTAPNSVALTLPTLNVITATPLTAGTYNVYLRLSGGAFVSAPVFNAAVTAAIVSAFTAPAIFSYGTAAFSSAQGSSNADGAALSFTISAGQQIGSGVVLGTVSTATISNASSALGAATPTPVTVTATINNNVGTQPAAGTTGFAVSAANTVDATSSAVSVATAAQGIAGAVTVPSTNVGQIDLAASSGSATKFTSTAASTTIQQLATVKFTNGTALTAAGAAYAIAGGDRVNATVTASAGFFAPLGTTTTLFIASSCGAGATIGASAVFTTTALAAAATSVTVTGATANPATGSTYSLCMQVNGTIAIVPGTPTGTFTLVKAAGTASDSNNVTTSTSLYALAYNAQVIDVNNFLPTANTGWSQFYRITNTGSVAAPVSAAFINETTGVVGTSAVVITSLAAGASSTITGSAIETALGAQAAAARPRVRFTASTNGMKVGNILFTPNGSFTNNSSEQ